MLTAEQREYIVLCANLESPRGPSAELNIDEDTRKAQLTVVLPGEGDNWDENEAALQRDIEEYLGSAYTVTIGEAVQDMDGRLWSEFEIAEASATYAP